jgi:hypothetical protein
MCSASFCTPPSQAPSSPLVDKYVDDANWVVRVDVVVEMFGERCGLRTIFAFDSIVITLEGGCELAFPVALVEGLADAPRSKLTKIKISPNGLGLHWPLLDADLYVPGLIEGAFGSHRWMQQIGKLGGSSRSSIKAEASRENGKRGGRPKQRVAA